MSCKKMPKKNQVNIEAYQTKLGFTIKAFDEILKKPENIDLSTGHFADLLFLKGLNDRFKAVQTSVEPVNIPLGFEDWVKFMTYLDQSRNVLANIDEAEILRSLYKHSLDVKRCVFYPKDEEHE